MNSEQLVEEFLQFLVNNNALNQWNVNGAKYHSEYWQSFLRENMKSSFIFDAFSWDDTKEGARYWGELSMKWLKIVNNNNL